MTAPADAATGQAAGQAALVGAAEAFHAAGCCVVPARADGSKAPATFWKDYQRSRPSGRQLREWLSGGRYDGFGVVCGAVSCGLEMLEFEGRALAEGYFHKFRGALADHGMAELGDRIASGYAEATPSGGVHLLVRVKGETRASTKLARRPARDDELTADEREIRARHPGKVFTRVLIETRGQGGFCVVAPSAGRTHETGRPWRLVAGGPGSIAVITDDERDALYAIASLLDEMPTTPPPAADQGRGSRDSDAAAGHDVLRPGDDFNARADWADILGPHGWMHVCNFGQARGWRRPGKNRGVSATTGHSDSGDRLFVFSSSTEFDTETPYSKFAAYTLLEHGGDYAAAAKALRAVGYGGHRPHQDDGIEDMIGGPTGFDGNTAGPLRPHPGGTGDHDPGPQPGPQPNSGPGRGPGPQVVGERTHRYSDDRNALALVCRFGDRIRYCPDRSAWLAWEDSRWRWCDRGGGIVAEYAKRIARSLPEDTRPELKYKQASLSARGIAACLTLARSDGRVVVGYGDLDARPWELNTPDGIIDLRTGMVRAADPASLHTRMTAVPVDLDADLGRWAEFLHDTFGDDGDLIAFMQRMAGYSAIGVVGPHVLPFCYGTGGNGKGVFLEALTSVLGDYAGKAPRGFLTVKAYDAHPQEIAKLAGLRMVLASETNENDRFDEAKVKELTGGDTLTGHFMRENDFSFTPTHQLWLMGNNKPEVATGGRSFWRRLRLIPFERQVPEHKIVDDLQGVLARDHGPALLAWIVRGAVSYSRIGLAEPQSVLDATAAYQREQDTVKQFIEDRCLIGGGQHVTLKKSVLYAAYERWCTSERLIPVTKNMLSRRLKEHGVGEDRTGKSRDRAYTNIALQPDDADDRSDPSDWIK